MKQSFGWVTFFTRLVVEKQSVADNKDPLIKPSHRIRQYQSIKKLKLASIITENNLHPVPHRCVNWLINLQLLLRTFYMQYFILLLHDCFLCQFIRREQIIFHKLIVIRFNKYECSLSGLSLIKHVQLFSQYQLANLNKIQLCRFVVIQFCSVE